MQIILNNNFKELNYNSNIDIIKGLSALLVLNYHLDLSVFNHKIIFNGYLGVDILCDLKEKRCDFITTDQHKIYREYGNYTSEGAKYFREKIFAIKWFILN